MFGFCDFDLHLNFVILVKDTCPMRIDRILSVCLNGRRFPAKRWVSDMVWFPPAPRVRVRDMCRKQVSLCFLHVRAS